MLIRKMKHRQGVGNPEHYDILGALQFNLLVKYGLREHHTLLDIGCGNLRAGRLFIVYLKSNKYYGLEPNEWMVKQAIDQELGNSLITLKQPYFTYNEDFDFSDFKNTKFDFVNCHSIFSHATKDQIKKCIKEVKKYTKKGSRFFFTFAEGKQNNKLKEYLYFKKVKYKIDWIENIILNNGFSFKRLDVNSPNKQTYILVERI
jgi:SAM-dependent methyltransferase